MTRKIVQFIVCLVICLSIAGLARTTLRVAAQPRAPTANPLPDQVYVSIDLPMKGNQDKTGYLTPTAAISQFSSVPAPPPRSTGRPSDLLDIPIQAAEFHPQYEALLPPVPLISTSNEVITKFYSVILPQLFPDKSSRSVLHNKGISTQSGEASVGDSPGAQSTCIVDSTTDSGSGTLRDCLQNAQAGDTITFNTTVFPLANPATISLQSILPIITVDELTIDASDAGVILDGSGLSSGPGLLVNGASGVQIRGLQIVSFPWDGIALIGGASNNVIEGNFIGTDASSTTTLGNRNGILIGYGASNNTVGGNTPGAGNIISGNEVAGIWLQNAGTAGNQIQGNLIGTDVSGTARLGNLYVGIYIGSKASNNVIGGPTPGAGNLISGNEDDGIHIQDADTTGNQIQGNFIGTSVSGTPALGNLDNGVTVMLGASNNIIGGNTSSAGNLISGNESDGIDILNAGTTGNKIQGNFIGTDVSGAIALGNLQMGVFIGFGATNNVVGGSTTGARNLISGNQYDGIRLQEPETTGNQIQGNFIGTDVSGTATLGNLRDGVSILNAPNNLIGGNRFIGSGSLGQGNLISGNQNDGIRLQEPETTGNLIQGNFIGTDVSGTAALGNLSDGIVISFEASDNLIGGDTAGAGNLISGNKDQGIQIQNLSTTGNLIQGNFIGTNVSGTMALGNLMDGITLLAGASDNLIGGDRFTGVGPMGQGNLISGNGANGIQIQNEGTNGNQVLGNFIGTNLSGTNVLSNSQDGIVIVAGGSNNLIGAAEAGQGNLISGNRTGIVFQYAGSSNNQVQGNFIGTDISGTAGLGNLQDGITIVDGASNNLIGGDKFTGNGPLGQSNLISSNRDDGIQIQDASDNQVRGNFIGTDVSGTAGLGNLDRGIVINLGASNNIIGGAMITAGNTIDFNGGDGVYVSDNQTLGNAISHNSIHDNEGLGIETTNGGNTELSPPTITRVISASISGQAQPLYIIEVFSDKGDEGRWFEGTVIADEAGVFTLSYSGAFSGLNLTATATDAEGNTSEFSPPMPINDHEKIFLPLIIKGSN